MDNYDQFFTDMGEVPQGMTLERRDNNAGYSPGNCVWAPPKEQLNNQRRNVRVTYLGRTQTVSQWAEELGIPYDTLYVRLQRYKMAPEKAFTQGSLRVTGWSHGTRTGYEYGCRCVECKAFNTARARAAREKRT